MADPSSFLHRIFGSAEQRIFRNNLRNLLGFRPRNFSLYEMALTHRSLKEPIDQNNERLEFLGDAILSSLVAEYLFKRYPYKEEGFLTEMRSKMVNRQQLNDIAIRMGLNKLALFNRNDGALRSSQIFGNTLEALVGAIYLDQGYAYTDKWVLRNLIQPHLSMDDLESIDLNLKNKLYGWVNRQGKTLEFVTLHEKLERGRRLFTIAAVIDGERIAEGKGFNKKDASQVAAQEAILILEIE
ncbi:MAG: ribonuclease III [Bacteroidetes bacterium]|nr:ribonuclease III [Bacteroidota bacterium]